MSEQWLPDEWIAALQDAFVHELFDLPGVSVLSYYPDWLHDKNLGSDQYTYGAILHVLCYEVMSGSPEENCKQITAECFVYWRTHPCEHFSAIRPDMFSGNWSSLKGRAVHIRNLGPALFFVWKQHMDPRNLTHQFIKLALKKSCEMEHIVMSTCHMNKMPMDQATRLLKATVAFCGAVTKLGKEIYHPQEKHIFAYTVKFHYLIHIALRAHLLHPRKTWCYGSESFLQHVRKIMARAALGGTNVMLVNNKAVRMYTDAMQAELGHTLKLKR